ncbi:tetratricopeptide repeat protein [Hathewaya massiliensis]|uniref:tetratricopeptide repeat protein n=1 Tax=Hathewaya massiliensis TaxID=1964382 RepID=UPI00115B947D|nr:hypothetical protein [Hathewaya massiliensis]
MFNNKYLYRESLGTNSKNLPYFYALEIKGISNYKLYKAYILEDSILFTKISENFFLHNPNNKKFIESLLSREIFYDNLNLNKKTCIPKDNSSFEVNLENASEINIKSRSSFRVFPYKSTGIFTINFKDLNNRNFHLIGRQDTKYIYECCKKIFPKISLINCNSKYNITEIAKYYSNLGHDYMALKIIENYINKVSMESIDESISFERARLLKNVGNYNESLNELLNLEDNFKDKKSLFNEISSIYILLNNSDKALKYTNMVLETFGGNPLTYFNMGKALNLKSEYEKALENFKLAEDLGYKDNDLIFNKALVFFNLEDYKKSLYFSEKYLQSSPKDIKAMLLKAETLYFLNQYKDEIALLDKIIAVDNTIFHAYCLKADALIKLEDDKKALKILNKTIRACPEYPLPYYIKACYYSKIADNESALKNLQQAIKLYPKYIDYALDDPRLNFIKFTSEFREVILKYENLEIT